MSAVKARIVNTDHNNVTLSVMTDLPTIGWTYRRSEVGSAAWQVPFSHPEVDRLNSAGPTGFGPKLTDFRIGVSGDNGTTWRTVHAGFCGPVGLDSDRDSIQVAGVDWTAWLDQPYRFGGYTNNTPDTWEEDDVVVYWISPGDDQQTVIEDLIANTWNGNALQMVHITPEFEGTGWTTAVYLTQLMLGDTTTILQKIKALGDMNEPWGFEFYMNWDKTLTMIAPRKTSIAAAASECIVSFAPSLENIQKINWTNNGPAAISLIGMPRDFPAFMDYSTHTASKLVYRDWLQFKSFGEEVYNNQEWTELITEAYAKQLRFPQHDMTITVDPTIVVGDHAPLTTPDPTWFFDNWCGSVIHVDSEEWFLPYHRINAYFWITSMEFRHDDAGNWLCTMTLEQVQN